MTRFRHHSAPITNSTGPLAGSATRTGLDSTSPSCLLAMPLLDSRDDEGVTLKLADYDQLEGILACMRTAGVKVKELRTVKTDLEDVFVSMMQGQGS